MEKLYYFNADFNLANVKEFVTPIELLECAYEIVDGGYHVTIAGKTFPLRKKNIGKPFTCNITGIKKYLIVFWENRDLHAQSFNKFIREDIQAQIQAEEASVAIKKEKLKLLLEFND